MLARAAGWLKPGGTLVYSVCSLERQEGEQVAADFLAGHEDYALEEEHRILPGAYAEQGGADSFFIARFVRRDITGDKFGRFLAPRLAADLRFFPCSSRSASRPRSSPPISRGWARRSARSTRPAPTGSMST